MPPPEDEGYEYFDAFPNPGEATKAMFADSAWTYWVEIHGNCDGRHVVVWRRPRRARND